MTDVVFTERQHLRKIALDGVFLILMIILGYGWVQQEVFGEPFGGTPVSSNGLSGGFLLILGLFLFFRFNRFDTRIDEEGVHYKIFPFQWSYRTYAWENLNEAYLRNYDAINEYGGFGYRLGLFGKGRAFIFGGDYGLQLNYQGRKILLGTQQPEALEAALKRFKP